MMMFCPFEEWWSGNILLQMAMLHHSPDNRAKRFRCQSKFQPPRSASSICYLSLPNHIFLFCGLLLQGILKEVMYLASADTQEFFQQHMLKNNKLEKFLNLSQIRTFLKKVQNSIGISCTAILSGLLQIKNITMHFY